MAIAEQKLWQAVILQAVQDALREIPRGMDGRLDREEAVSFFESLGEWRRQLHLCCHLAGFEPAYILEGYEKAKKNRGDYTALLSAVGKDKLSVHKGICEPERKQSKYSKAGNGRGGAGLEANSIGGRWDSLFSLSGIKKIRRRSRAKSNKMECRL